MRYEPYSYGPSVVPQVEAAKEGYGQILWLLGEDHTLTEVSHSVLVLDRVIIPAFINRSEQVTSSSYSSNPTGLSSLSPLPWTTSSCPESSGIGRSFMSVLG